MVVKMQKLSKLTKRELETARLIAKGLDNQEIAEILGCSVSAISVHRYNLQKKLGTKNNVQIALLVWKEEPNNEMCPHWERCQQWEKNSQQVS